LKSKEQDPQDHGKKQKTETERNKTEAEYDLEVMNQTLKISDGEMKLSELEFESKLTENEEIKNNGVYTTNEAMGLLKISDSTIKRLLKNGILRANKVGGQYRILGKELLRLISPELEKKSVKKYLTIETLITP
jgi:excisionase family DNA binding protein